MQFRENFCEHFWEHFSVSIGFSYFWIRDKTRAYVEVYTYMFDIRLQYTNNFALITELIQKLRYAISWERFYELEKR